MLQRLLAAAEQGENVWIGDFREACRALPEARQVILRLTALDGKQHEWELRLPVSHTHEETAFLREYLAACVFNLLSCHGGTELRFFLLESESDLLELVSGLEDIFQLKETKRSGYGKVISISDRLSRAFGGNQFRFSVDAVSNRGRLPTSSASEPTALGEYLRRITAEAEHGLRCGIDIGGTDIKAAVSQDGKLLAIHELDWNPASYLTADEITGPILLLTRLLQDEASLRDFTRLPQKLTIEQMPQFASLNPGGLKRRKGFDSIGISFPDVVIANRILGGETPKTQGLRANPKLDYEMEFSKLSNFQRELHALCNPDGFVRLANDGNIAAFTAAVEMASRGDPVTDGVFAHSLGTDLGTGWLTAQGRIPDMPLEMYDYMLDLGSYPQRQYPPEDVRSVRNENSGLPDARKYLGQAAAFRLAQEKAPELLQDYLFSHDGILEIRKQPEDKRKQCLEHLMQEAARGNPDACDIFRSMGRHLGEISREIEWTLKPGVSERYLYGRFVKHAACFALLQEGCREVCPELILIAADESLACSPLMRALADIPEATVAQFGQAIGSIYYGLTD